MQGAEWARLSRPFSPEAFGWYVVEIAADREQVRLSPYLTTQALAARLDAELGVGGWSFTLAPLPRAVICNLTIAGVTRAAVATAEVEPLPPAATPAPVPSSDPTASPDATVLAELALSRCAVLFGIAVPAAADDGWVDADVEAGEALFTPALVYADDHHSVGEPTAATTAPIADGGSGEQPAPAALAAPVDSGEAEGRGRANGHQVIDRLLERLRAEGLGKAAAQLVVEHHGYGRTPEEARVLYGKLRGLLLEKTLVTS